MKPLVLLRRSSFLHVCLFSLWVQSLPAGDPNPPPPQILVGRDTNGLPQLQFPYPAVQAYTVFGATNPAGPYVTPVPGLLAGPTFTVTNPGPHEFFRVGATPMKSNDLLSATVLNRLTYGPTPDDIDHIQAIGPEAYIAEQLAAEAIPDTVDTDPQITNAPPASPPLTNWIRVSATGTAGGGNFGIYLGGAGRAYVDNIWLTYGTNADSGTNLLANADFEDPTLVPPWTRGSSITAATTITNSPTVDGQAASGTNCLLLVANAAASSITTGFWQAFSSNAPAASQKFTLSYSYLPIPNSGGGTNLIARLSAGGTSLGTTNAVQFPVSPPAPPLPPPSIVATYEKLTNALASINDLRRWHVFRAIHSKRQLHEVLAQFFQNHFTTQYDKTYDYFDVNFNVGAYTNDTIKQNIAVDLHWREHKKFRDLLLNPNCTFHDLLKVSIESPAMIIYLDTILSTRTSPNQNYARELLELHTMGADNGYVQRDIVDLAKIWTGWRVEKKVPAVANDPFAAPIPRTDRTNLANTTGQWVLHYQPSQHDSNSVKRLFTNSVIDPRFSAQFRGGQPYSLIISNNVYRGTNGMMEGHLVAEHLANLPYTMEFLSVKLCQLFVHEKFEYGVYDYTTADPPPEVELIRQCMTAWDTPAGDGRKGNIRAVLNAIFASPLFRGHGASQQKIKTPLELAVSAVRALRVVSADTNNYTVSTADSDGAGIAFDSSQVNSPLKRMGNMILFNRAEPDGFSELGSIWLNTANLCERMRFVQHLLMPNGSSTKDDDYTATGLANVSDPVRLLKLRLPSSSWNDAGAVVDFFLGLIYPGEGQGNLGLDRAIAINFLNSNEAGVQSANTLFSDLTNPTAYDGRIRGMVATLMCLPRFQEQ